MKVFFWWHDSTIIFLPHLVVTKTEPGREELGWELFKTDSSVSIQTTSRLHSLNQQAEWTSGASPPSNAAQPERKKKSKNNDSISLSQIHTIHFNSPFSSASSFSSWCFYKPLKAFFAGFRSLLIFSYLQLSLSLLLHPQLKCCVLYFPLLSLCLW